MLGVREGSPVQSALSTFHCSITMYGERTGCPAPLLAMGSSSERNKELCHLGTDILVGETGKPQENKNMFSVSMW